jgi:hypothetical protein
LIALGVIEADWPEAPAHVPLDIVEEPAEEGAPLQASLGPAMTRPCDTCFWGGCRNSFRECTFDSLDTIEASPTALQAQSGNQQGRIRGAAAR